MADIKGINIKLGADTTALTSALKGVNKEINTTGTALKSVNKALKLDPTNTELLKQKQSLLADQIGSTKEKLDTLKEAQKQAAEQVKNGDLGKEKYAQLSSEVVITQKKLEDLEKEQKKCSSSMVQEIQKISDKTEKLGKDFSSAASAMKPLSTAAAGVLGGSLVAFNKVDEGLDIVVTKTGATGEALKGMEQNVKNIATSIPTDFATAGEAVGEVNTRFALTGQELEDLSAQFVKFAQINGTDVTSSVDSVQKALSAFGLGAEDASGLLDSLTKVSQNTGISVDTLASGLLSNATAFQELGLSVGQSAELMGQIEVSGADVSTVMGGLKKALKNATAEGKPLNQALSELQDSILNGTESTDGLTEAYDLFGKSGDQIYNAVKSGTLDFADLASMLGDTDEALGTVSDTFEGTLDPIDSFKTTLNQLAITGAEIGSPLGTLLQPVLENLASGLQSITDAFTSLDPQAQQAIVLAITAVAAIAPILSLLSGLMGGINSLMTLLPLLAGPVGIVIGLIAAVMVAGGLLITHWEEIKQFAIGLWQSITQTFESIKETIVGIWESICKTASDVWGSTEQNIIQPVQSVWDTVTTTFTDLWSSVQQTWEDIKEAIVSPIESAYNTVSGWIEDIKGLFNFSWSLPTLKVPHVSVDGGKAPWGIGGLGRLPHFSVNWYKKAMDNAIRFDSPTVIPTAAGMKGFGDAGSEWVVGNDALMGTVQAAVEKSGDNSAVLARLQSIEDKMENLTVVLDSGAVVGGITDKMNCALGDSAMQTERGW